MRAGPASRDEFYLAFIVCLHHVITTIKKSILANRTGVFIIFFFFFFFIQQNKNYINQLTTHNSVHIRSESTGPAHLHMYRQGLTFTYLEKPKTKL